MIDMKFPTLRIAMGFHHRQVAAGIYSTFPVWDGEVWVVRTIET